MKMVYSILENGKTLAKTLLLKTHALEYVGNKEIQGLIRVP